MGDQLRFTPEGPRELDESDFRKVGSGSPNEEKPKVIQNPVESRITAPASFDPLVERARHQKLFEKLDERAGTQRGKPRSRDPRRNPLGGRIYDINCRWPLYRQPYQKSFPQWSP
jgi:hypothetical protein